MARGDIVIANSRYTADIVKKRYATPEDRIRVIHRGVDLEAFNPAIVSQERITKLRNQWGIADHRRVVLHAARLTKWKGQREVIAAAARIRDKAQDCVFILAGDAQGRDDYRDALLRQTASLGLTDTVRLVGHIDDMPAAFAAAHTAIVASIEPEAFGRTAVEAQAMACPVIATKIGAPSETVLASPCVADRERTGWLVPPADVAAYEAALLEALSLTDIARAEIGVRARKHATEKFSTSEMQRRTLAVYDSLLRGIDGKKAHTLSSAAHVPGALDDRKNQLDLRACAGCEISEMLPRASHMHESAAFTHDKNIFYPSGLIGYFPL
jgi:glycosyltransferase involved in cell wall biosynthesis